MCWFREHQVSWRNSHVGVDIGIAKSEQPVAREQTANVSAVVGADKFKSAEVIAEIDAGKSTQPAVIQAVHTEMRLLWAMLK